MRESYNKEIGYEGIYWWSDAANVINPLMEELRDITSETQIWDIVITGNDFNDGRQRRTIKIRVDQNKNKITIQKEYF